MNNAEVQTGKTILRNVIYGFSTWAVPLVLSFVVTPIIIRSVGTGDYGIYVLVLGFVGYSFNINFVRAITKYLAEYRTEDLKGRMNDVISAAASINIPIGLAGALIMASLANWLVSAVLLVPKVDQEKTVYALYLAAGIMFLTMIGQMFNSVFQGLHRFDVFSRIFNTNSVLLLVGNGVLAYLGFGIHALLTWNLVVLTISGSIAAIATKRLLPSLRVHFRSSNPELKRILTFSAGIIGYQVLSNGLLLFERGWLMRSLGPESVAYYVVPLTLGIQLHGFIASLMIVVFPLSSELSRDRPKLKRMYQKATKLVLFLIFFIGASLLVQGKEFLGLWIGTEFARESWLILSVLTVAFGLLAIQIVTWQMNEGLGQTSLNFKIFVVCVAVSVPLMITLSSSYGKLGVAIGRLAGFAAIFLSTFMIEKKIFGSLDGVFWFRNAGSLLAAAVCAALIEFGILGYLSASWPALVISTFCGFAVYLGIALMAGIISEEDKHLLRQFATR